jgi:hypothetical protein
MKLDLMIFPYIVGIQIYSIPTLTRVSHLAIKCFWRKKEVNEKNFDVGVEDYRIVDRQSIICLHKRGGYK